MGLITRTLQPLVNAAWRLTHAPSERKPRATQRRNYQAGTVSRLTNDWTSVPLSADQIVFQSLRTLRARSREQVQTNDYAKRFVQLMRTNVVGDQGFRLQSQVEGFNGRADQPAREAIELHYKEWMKPGNCDFKHRQHFVDICGLVVNTLCGDGEVFIRERESGPFMMQLELIDPELIDVTLNQQLNNGGMIRFGIEYDAADRAVAYHVTSHRNDPNAMFAPYNGGYYVRIPASQVTHLYVVEFVGQRRGIPWAATSLQRMKMASAMEDAALVAGRIGASKMGFFKSSQGDQYEGDQPDADEPVMEIAPGTFENIGNLDFQAFDPEYPKGEFAGFMKNALRGISAGLGVSYNTLAQDLEGVNFASMRHGVVEDREVFKAIQAWIIRSWLDGMFYRWLDNQLALQTITIPDRQGRPRPLNRGADYYHPARFQPRRWSWVDILKEVQAKKEEILLGLTSISRIIREMGHDPDEVFEEIKQERELLTDMGILPAILAGQHSETGEAQNNAEETEPGRDPEDTD